MSKPTFEIEKELLFMGYNIIAGVDECGRGPGAGPVVAAAVIIPLEVMHDLIGEVNDSKKLSDKRRKELCKKIVYGCDVGIGSIDNNIIDDINILEATKLAMRLALNELEQEPTYILIDGNFVIKELVIPHHPVIKGDSLSLSIAAASIVAKVYRDEIMIKLHEQFPLYGWDKNKGYLTKDHINALKEYGPCKYHRLSFNKVGS